MLIELKNMLIAGLICSYNGLSGYTEMQLIRGLQNIKFAHKGCVVTVGNFDGVHLGHQYILQQLRVRADILQIKNCVISFEPLPREFFSGFKCNPRLSNLREKYQFLQDNKVDQLLCVPFNKTFSSYTANHFIEYILIQKLAIKHILVGEDFRFGCDRSGNLEKLYQAGSQAGFTVARAPTFIIDGIRVSSTRIRQLLHEGNCVRASHLLGRNFSLIGKVISGLGLGAKQLVATANLMIGRNRHLPLRGVFAVKVQLLHPVAKEKTDYLGVANIGFRPTMTAGIESCEIHLLDFSGNLYGRFIKVTFIDRLRDEKKFPSSQELSKAILQDIVKARDILSQYNS